MGWSQEPLVLWGLTFRGLTREDLLRHENTLKHIITVNAEAIVLANETLEFRDIINENVACFDGQVPLWIARSRFRSRHFEKLSGSDLIYDFAELARRNRHSMFLLGGSVAANRGAEDVLRERFGANVYGYAPPQQSYPFSTDLDEMILAHLRHCRPSILLVAFGMPKQELWIRDHRGELESLGVRWAMGVGGAFDFVAGLEVRAPRLVQAIGIEGLWRLVQRPSRWRRFLRTLTVFRYTARSPRR